MVICQPLLILASYQGGLSGGLSPHWHLQHQLMMMEDRWYAMHASLEVRHKKQASLCGKWESYSFIRTSNFTRKSSDNPYSRRSWCWFNYNYLLWKHVHHILQCPWGVFLTSWVRSHTLWCHNTPLVWQVISPHSQAQCEGTDHIVFVSCISYTSISYIALWVITLNVSTLWGLLMYQSVSPVTFSVSDHLCETLSKTNPDFYFYYFQYYYCMI